MVSNKTNFKCFILMPYGKSDEDRKKFNDVFTKGIQVTAKRVLNCDVLFFRADMTLKAFELAKNVHSHIEEADFCIADITDSNPNVLYELGYAKAKGKELIIITQDDGPYPIDISNMIISKYSTDDDDAFEILSQNLASSIERAIESTQNKVYSIKDSYDVKCFQNRYVAHLNNAFLKAKNKIDILQTNLETIEKENLDSLTYALEHNKDLKLRILTLDPESYFAQKRAEQLGRASVHYRDVLHKSIRSLSSKLSKFGEQFSLRIYEDFPTQITFMIDDHIYSCTVARNIKSRELCTFMLEKYLAGVERSFIFHFDAIWVNSREYMIHTL